MAATLTLPLATREKLFLAGGGAAVLAFLLYMLPGGGDEAGVELASAPATAPVTSVQPASPPPAPVPATPAPSSIEGLVLKGVFGGGPRGGAAIFHLPGGNERTVPIGRDVVPGVSLKAVGVGHAILAGAGRELRLELGRSGAAAEPSSTAAAPSQLPGAEGIRRETIEYRLGLQPVQADGRAAGYALKPGASLPRLQKAGLRAGDVIVGVNGSRFDEERMMELAWQASNSGTTQVEFLRDGRRMTAEIGASGR